MDFNSYDNEDDKKKMRRLFNKQLNVEDLIDVEEDKPFKYQPIDVIDPIDVEEEVILDKDEVEVKTETKEEIKKDVEQVAKQLGTTEDIPDEVKEEIADQWALQDKNIKETTKAARNKQKLLFIMEAAAKMFTAGTGSEVPSAFYQRLSDQAEKPVEVARRNKLLDIKNFRDNKADKHREDASEQSKIQFTSTESHRKDKLAAENARTNAMLTNQRRIQEQKQKDREDLKTVKEKQRFEKKSKEEIAFHVPGYGSARTKKEAQTFRDEVSSAQNAIADLEEVKRLGTDVNILDRTKVGKIQQRLMTAIGKLRLSVLGPGVMTDSERAYLRENLGDPTILFSTEGIQQAKLDQLIEQIGTSVKNKGKQVISGPTNEAPLKQETPREKLERLRAAKKAATGE